MTKIEWADETWNPTTGCDKVSRGCKHCYAEIQHRRMMFMHPTKYTKPFLGHVEMHWDELLKPMRWRNPRRIFVNSMSDLFHKDVSEEFIRNVFSIMASCPQHQFLVLTKRPERMQPIVSAMNWYKTTRHCEERSDEAIPIHIADNCLGLGKQLDADYTPPNIWLGTSVEDFPSAGARIPYLLSTPAAIRFLSCEPLIGPVSLRGFLNFTTHFEPTIHWVIAGGESGSKADPVHPDWVRTLRDQCKAAGIPFFFKQWGEWLPSGQGRVPDPRHTKALCLAPDGEFEHYPVTGNPTILSRGITCYKTGKHDSGRMLDGELHDQWPETKNSIPDSHNSTLKTLPVSGIAIRESRIATKP